MARGEGLSMRMPVHPQTSNKPAKKLKAKEVAASVAVRSHKASRAAGAVLGESSNWRLYCSLTKGIIPPVCGQESHNFLERQVVGLSSPPPFVTPSFLTISARAAASDRRHHV